MTPKDIEILKKLGLARYIKSMSIIHRLPEITVVPELSPSVKKRLKWMDYYSSCRNASLTCRYFGISRKTFYGWRKRYNPYDLISLEERSRRPHRLRQWQVTREEESRVKALRQRYIRTHYLLEGKIENIQTDNGSEFAKYFRLAVQSLNLGHYYSRPRTPKDNSFDERFNRTLEDEFIDLGHLTSDCDIFNKELTEWLVEYNFYRPHESLGYDTPINFHYKHHKVLPMYPAST